MVVGGQVAFGPHRFADQCMRPLPKTYPELEVLENHPISVEYRVYNYRLAKDGSNVIRRRNGYSVWDIILLAGVYSSWRHIGVLALFILTKCTVLTILAVLVAHRLSACAIFPYEANAVAVGYAVYFLLLPSDSPYLPESIIVFPHIGIQIETTRGLIIPFTEHTQALSTSRRFVPADSIHDVLINEGLRTWDWYYYLAVLCRSPPRSLKGPSPPYEISMLLAFEVRIPLLSFAI
jgi:phosphatidylinositol glycan class H protein